MDKGRKQNNFIALFLVFVLFVIPACIQTNAATITKSALNMSALGTEKQASESTEKQTSEGAEKQSSEGMEKQSSEGTDDFIEILVEGNLEKFDHQALLDRLNEIREEACQEGVSNPVNGEPLRPEDYVPLEWSYELEKIAILRAAESTILQDHVRPDGSDCFSAAPEGVPFTMETLAWGFGSAAAAVEGWYSEKSAYVEETGTPAGHYIALINPENRFVGIADLRAEWQRDACAGAFASHGETGSGIDAASESLVWSIPLRKSYLPAVINRAVEITARKIYNSAQFGR